MGEAKGKVEDRAGQRGRCGHGQVAVVEDRDLDPATSAARQTASAEAASAWSSRLASKASSAASSAGAMSRIGSPGRTVPG